MFFVAAVESVWRYPVKSMQGEKLDAAFVGFPGVYGDRIYAFRSSAAEAGFPYLTAREHHDMLLYQPRFRAPPNAKQPTNLEEAESLDPGLTSVYPAMDDLVVDVETPSGEVLSLDDPELLKDVRAEHKLSLLRSHRAMTDCRPVSLISLQTVAQLSKECGLSVDKRQFRANIYLDFQSADGFAEDSLVGKTVTVGDKLRLSILERDPRCAMIALDPETGKAHPMPLRQITNAHDGMAGVYAAVLVEGTVRPGDPVTLQD